MIRKEIFWIILGTLLTGAALAGETMRALGVSTPAATIDAVRTSESALEQKVSADETTTAAGFARIDQKLDDIAAAVGARHKK